MKKSFWFAAAAVATTIALVTGATLALFSNATVNSSGAVVAGTLCMTSDRDDGDPIPGPMFYVDPAMGTNVNATGFWAPGDTVTRTLIVNNNHACSNLDAWLSTATAHLDSGDPNLAAALQVTVTTAQAGHPGDVIVAQGTLAQFLAGTIPLRYSDDNSKIPMFLGSLRFLHFTVTFDKAATNSLQGTNLVVDFTVNGMQMKHNP